LAYSKMIDSAWMSIVSIVLPLLWLCCFCCKYYLLKSLNLPFIMLGYCFKLLNTSNLVKCIFIFCSAGVWIQGLALTKQALHHLSHTHSPNHES
jgi:hypothetical protein